jgi:hypothetical protein
VSGYSDLHAYESDDERNAVCAELARMLRIVPLTPLAATASPELSPDGEAVAIVGSIQGGVA